MEKHTAKLLYIIMYEVVGHNSAVVSVGELTISVETLNLHKNMRDYRL